MSKATHVVVQSGLYFGTNSETGRLEEMTVNTQLTLTKKQAEKLTKRGFVKSLKDVETIDVSDSKKAPAPADGKDKKSTPAKKNPKAPKQPTVPKQSDVTPAASTAK